MLANRHNRAVQNIINLFEEAGYDISLTMVNAKDYGVAEERKRVFILDLERICQLNLYFLKVLLKMMIKNNFKRYYMGSTKYSCSSRRKKIIIILML